jgi:DNA-binding NarL/FixJ family response regulator
MSTNWSEQGTGGERGDGWKRSGASRQSGRPELAGAERVTAIILDQDPRYLEAVEQALKRLEIRVVGKATMPERALALAVERKPDLLVADIETGDSEIEGIACLRQAQEHLPHLKIIVLSASGDRDRMAAAFVAGASAYVYKRSHPDDFVAAIRQLFEHSIFFAGDRLGTTPDRQVWPPLTRRETQILQLVAEGKSNPEVARTLWIQEQTVKFHLSNIYRKLGAPNRTAAARWAHAQMWRQRSGAEARK